MVHKKTSKIKKWFKEHQEEISFMSREGLLMGGAGAVLYGIASGQIPPEMGEQALGAVVAGTALNVFKRSEEEMKKKK